MRDAVICEPLRTPVGALRRRVQRRPGDQARRHRDRRAARAHRRAAATQIDDVLLGQCYPNGEAPAIGRVAALDAGLPVDGPRLPARPPLRLGPAGRSSTRLHAGPDRRRRHGDRGRRREHEPGRVLLVRLRWGVKGGGVELADRLARGRVTAGGVNYPVPGRHARDGREPPPRVLDPARGAGRVGAALAPTRRRRAARTARFDDEIVPVTRPRPQGRARRSTATSTRAPTPRSSRWPRCAPVMLKHDPEATVTAGNASGQNDGASVCLVTTRRRPPSSGCGRLAGSSPGPSPACRRSRWASARFRPRPRRSSAPGSSSPTST